MMHKPMQVGVTLFLLAGFKALPGLSTIASAQSSSKWVHSAYSNGVTSISIIETLGAGSTYLTVMNGNSTLYGSFSIDRIQQDKTYIYLSGQFIDTCTGQIRIRRPNSQSGLPIVAEVTWIVTREPVPFKRVKSPNQNCKTPNGQKFQLTLPEALPKSDQRGEFTNTNSTTFFADSEFGTWTQWQVVSADGILNCRDQPYGTVKHTYGTGQIIGSMGRQNNNLVETPRGRFWLQTRERCYVRANNQFLRPISLPTNRL